MSRLVVAAAILAAAGAADAATLAPASYDMPNGQTGSFTYFDDTYDAPGAPVATPLAPLAGGLGDLADGVVATANWNAAPGAYVGWQSVDPLIVFRFDAPVAVQRVLVSVDDSNGMGGVRPPASVRFGLLGGSPALVAPVADPVSGAPFTLALDLPSEIVGADFALQLFRQPNSWLFVSEIAFEGRSLAVPSAPSVPVPAAGPLLAAALAGAALLARRRSTARS